MRQAIWALGLAMVAWAGAPPALHAQQAGTEEAVPAATNKGEQARRDCPPGVGCVTRLPLPRYVSLKGAETRARRGPGSSHRVDWIYRRAGLPVKVTAEYENWRRVEDPEGAGGWIHYALLSSSRTVIVTQDMAPLRAAPDDGAGVLARAETGVVARVTECRPDWCRVTSTGLRGWLPKTSLWGVGPDEVFD